uniref:C-type lectin domain-containing protein n=1 Tax=Acrobeloides nanus TaxID=290746 RepID=A0A914CRS8_9BILA
MSKILCLTAVFLLATIANAQVPFVKSLGRYNGPLLTGSPCFGHPNSVKTYDNCFVFVHSEEINNAQEAQNYCSSKGFGTLASIATASDKRVLMDGAKVHLPKVNEILVNGEGDTTHIMDIFSDETKPVTLAEMKGVPSFACQKICCWCNSCGH